MDVSVTSRMIGVGTPPRRAAAIQRASALVRSVINRRSSSGVRYPLDKRVFTASVPVKSTAASAPRSAVSDCPGAKSSPASALQ